MHRFRMIPSVTPAVCHALAMIQRRLALAGATAGVALVAMLVTGVAANAATVPTPSPSVSVTPKPTPTLSALASPSDAYPDPQWSLYDYNTSNVIDEAILSAATNDAATPLIDLGKTGDAGPRATAPPFGITASIDPDVEPIVAKSANGTSTTAVTFYLSVSAAHPDPELELTGYSTITILLDARNTYVGCAVQVVYTWTLHGSNGDWIVYPSKESWSMASDTGSYREDDEFLVNTGVDDAAPIIYPGEDAPAPAAVNLAKYTASERLYEYATGGSYDYSDYVAASALSETVAAQELVNAESFPLWSSSLMG